MNDTTRTFLNDLSDSCMAADNLTGRKAVQHLKGLVTALEARNIPYVSNVDPAQVELSAHDWEKVIGSVRMQLSSAKAEM